ncbi:MAG TPA: ABC transporter ATP-binding protein [Firmicutes bacterium]|nr:ABC transporter ATP-binding protein [Bacillota bacterium]
MHGALRHKGRRKDRLALTAAFKCIFLLCLASLRAGRRREGLKQREAAALAFSIQITDLTKQYRKGPPALNKVNLNIQSGMFGLLGPNGAGKTTLMRILATLLQPLSGEVYVGGVNLADNPGAVRAILGYLPQDFNTYRRLTVRQVLDYVALLKGLDAAAARRQKVELVLAQVHLKEKRHTQVAHLSGGMRQRLGIGQALLGDPQLLIVDEPTAGLDPEERIRFRNLLVEISKGKVVLLSTHIVGDVESCCSRLAVLNQGNVCFTGSPAELAAKARGQVWEIAAAEEQHTTLPASARVIATRRIGDTVHRRILSPMRPLPAALPVEPTLEEGYLQVVKAGATP